MSTGLKDRSERTASSADLQAKSRWVRQSVVRMIAGANRGHIGGSLSATDLLVALYHSPLLRFDTRSPLWDERDRFIMSKGHAVEALYSVLASAGFFDAELLNTYGKSGSRLGGHVDHHLPGIDVSTGSLGHGLGIGAGLALAGKLDGRDSLTVAMLGDGECYEGSVWEAANFAAHHRLRNLVAIIDRNGFITLDSTEAVNELEPFASKWKAFGWEVQEFDGHSFEAISGAWRSVKDPTRQRPIALIASTIKGKGISFMEGTPNWHHNVPKGTQLETAEKDVGI